VTEQVVSVLGQKGQNSKGMLVALDAALDESVWVYMMLISQHQTEQTDRQTSNHCYTLCYDRGQHSKERSFFLLKMLSTVLNCYVIKKYYANLGSNSQGALHSWTSSEFCFPTVETCLQTTRPAGKSSHTCTIITHTRIGDTHSSKHVTNSIRPRTHNV